MKFAHLALLLALGAGLWGCATPRYQTFYRYEPPTDAAAHGCLERCAQTQKACLDRCGENYAVCVREIEPEAQARHADALKRYEGELTQYRRDLDRYHLSISLGWGYGGWYGAGWYDPWWPYGGYWAHYYPPEPPHPPSYADELGKLREQVCDRGCGCQPAYDACFLSCGGIKVPEQRCIANCPKAP